MKRLLWQLKLLRLQGSIPLCSGLVTRSWVSVTVVINPYKTSITVDRTSGIHKQADLVDFQIGLPDSKWGLIELTRRFGSALVSDNVCKWAKLGMLNFISHAVRDALKQPTTNTSSESVACLMKFRTLVPEFGITGELILKGVNFALDMVEFATHQSFMAWFLDRLGYELVVMECRSDGWKVLGPFGSFRTITAAPDRKLGVASIVLKEAVHVPFVSLTRSVVRGLQLLELLERRGRR
ncbi:hypothetical protein DRO59_02235 [Candidatus Bathyarchaeota archaeon]|nr:MAG: hypothetical protein DRO59_02235 [Candidatus Bathyarchaeota archaeon]